MNRRGFFATLLAPLVARFAPKPKATSLLLDDLNAYTLKHIVPAATDQIFKTSPVFARLNGAYSQAWAGSETFRPMVFLPRYEVPWDMEDA